ncbi:SMI1/KNR4 family protein [Maribacter ulvicola]|uniref:Cell wall assembly regulator SMI1 n=1 Tax=Maribacter ulvicola TaxID=228959 RepID=A0A1N6RNZ7_9FLAO|nr:SMI1/KNR4 family protein [Maribacter ulvicola]SIQ30416.1 Cell wall assembly regulator SMI1 [Maribacter ulvicola]
MRNRIAFSDNVEQMKWDDFHFNVIPVNTLPPLEDPEDIDNSFTFCDALLDAFKEASDKEVIKLLFLTPEDISSSKFYGIAFLEGKEVFTAEIENTSLFKEWFTVVDERTNRKETITSKVYFFGANSFSSQPISNFKNDQVFKNTGAFISDHIPNAFIAEKLAKEKADFIAPFIQLEAKSNFEKVVQQFVQLIHSKELTIIPPKNNDAIYAEFEAAAGYPFPTIIKEFLTLHNGVQNSAIMGAEKIFQEWKDWQWVYNDWTQKELLDTYSTNEGKTLLMYTTPYWIPFFDMQNGNFLAFDFAPNTKGTAGQIIRFGADQEIGYIQADSLELFLEQLMDDEGDIEDYEWFRSE